jgi:hypothetical protein
MCMYCPSCGHPVKAEQKFCQDCGRSLVGVPEATEPLKIRSSPEPPAEFATRSLSDDATTQMPVGTPEDLFATPDALPDLGDLPTREITPRLPIPDPDWATPTGDIPALPADPMHAATNALPAPALPDAGAPPPPTDITSTTQIPMQAGPDATTTMNAVPTGHTDEYPAVFDGSADMHEYPRTRDPFKLKLVFVLAIFGAIAVLMAAVADIIDIFTSAPVDGIDTGIESLDTLGTNLAVAGFFGATVMALGGLLACFGFRWGAGLAGGAGLALTGWAAMIAGLAELRIASAESITRQTTDIAFTLKVTRDLGFWLTVAVGVIGVLVFIASLRSFGTGGRPALNPWIGALGAVAGVVLVAGPLLPEGNATFANNFKSATTTLDLPAAYFAGRLVQLALIGFAIVFGLLVVRAYGLGLAAGGVSVAFWMWLSSLLDMGTFPLGIASGNFGAVDSTPHAVTSVGMALTIFMLVVAAVLAAVGSSRQRQFGY